MKEKIKCTIRYSVLALVTGVAVGAIDTIFGRGLLWLSDFRTAHYRYLLPFLPVAGLLIVWMYHRFSEESLKGMTLVLETGQKKRKSIPLALVPLVIVGTWLTHLFGGSAGREGVAVQIGAVISHEAGRKFRCPENDRIMLVAGMAAGFGGLFQTPLAAVFFAMEVIASGYMQYEALLPAMISAYTAAFTSHILGLEKFTAVIGEKLDLSETKVILSLIVLGILFGLVGRLFSGTLQWMKKRMGNAIKNPYIRIGAVAVFLAVLLFLFHGGRYSGLGTNLISAAFENGTIYGYDWILKLGFTVLTLAIGFQGGEVTPLFSIGASLGILAGNLLGISPVVCAALGYAAVFGSATNTLLAPVMIGLEVFGTENAIPLVVVCILAYLMNGGSSIYTAQQRAVLKLDGEKEIEIFQAGRESLEEAVRLVQSTEEKMKEKSWFVAESLEEFDRWMRKDQGWLYVAKDCSSGQLAGMFFVVLPGMEEENLGYDIGMQGRQLYECAIMDTVVVLPEYRGMHLQYEMMQTAERKLHKEGYRYLLCTVHPENKFSRANVKRQGYKKILTKEKYGGFLRDIWMKEL